MQYPLGVGLRWIGIGTLVSIDSSNDIQACVLRNLQVTGCGFV
jgi:hypothetical protein